MELVEGKSLSSPLHEREAARLAIQIACEQIAQFKEMRGVSGVHLMAIEWEHKMTEIAEKAHLLPRPKI
jgi:methylenetetrahydrofolate reductase (NADPH)